MHDETAPPAVAGGEPTHAQMLDRLLDRLAEIERAAADSDQVLALRLAAVDERLQAGGPRFLRIERLLEEAAECRAQQAKEIRELARRLLAIETAKAIARGVERVDESRWAARRRWVYRALVFLMGPGAGLTVLIWWLTHRPPPPSG